MDICCWQSYLQVLVGLFFEQVSFSCFRVVRYSLLLSSLLPMGGLSQIATHLPIQILFTLLNQLRYRHIYALVLRNLANWPSDQRCIFPLVVIRFYSVCLMEHHIALRKGLSMMPSFLALIEAQCLIKLIPSRGHRIDQQIIGESVKFNL